MRRSGFTMVELIFVIIIIGILAAMAIPKFGDIKDRAKINSEYASLSALDGTITAKIEFQREDSNGDNINVNWHGSAYNPAASATAYATANTAGDILSKIVKKGDKLRVVAYVDVDSVGSSTDSNTSYDVIFIEGQASNNITGVEKTTDTAGRPDKNDIWVFNTSPVNATITTSSGTTIVASGEIALIDINITTDTAITYLDGAAVDSNDDLNITVGGLTTIEEL